MKKLLPLFSAILLNGIIYANNPSAITKIETAMHTSGSLIKQEVFSIDNIPAFRMDVIKITNLENFSISSGVKVGYKIQIGKETKTIHNYIDPEEIDGLITTLEYMKTILRSKMTPSSYTEIKYISRSGFEVVLFTILNEKNKLDWSFSAQLGGENHPSSIELTTDDIERLKKSLLQAKEKL